MLADAEPVIAACPALPLRSRRQPGLPTPALAHTCHRGSHMTDTPVPEEREPNPAEQSATTGAEAADSPAPAVPTAEVTDAPAETPPAEPAAAPQAEETPKADEAPQ